MSLRRGFTLVELLVVIAIIGVLVALLLPSIQAARESARRSQCASQLKQIGLALQSHHDGRGAFPTGRTSTRQFGVSWAFQLLPYAEEAVVHDARDANERVDAEANAVAMRTAVPLFVCPSRRAPVADRDFDDDDQPSQTPQAGAAGDYAANAGRRLLVGLEDSTADERRPARKVDPAEAGPMFSYSRINARRVTDGLSQTLAAGEKHLPPEPFDPPAGNPVETPHYWQGDTAYFAADNPNAVLRVSTPGLRPDSEPVENLTAEREAFGGPHPGVTLFAFLDGRVEAVANDTEVETLDRLAAVGDGEVAVP